MVDYPTSANFLMNLPAYAVKEVLLLVTSSLVCIYQYSKYIAQIFQ